MNLLHLSERENFFNQVGQVLSMNNVRCFINLETLEVEIYSQQEEFMMEIEDEEEEQDPAREALNNPAKYLPVEAVSSQEAFRVMSDFVDTVKDPHMAQRLTDALNGRKPFANFNHLVHSTEVREEWFDFKNKTYTAMAKEWIEENASDELKKKIEALRADS